MGAVAFEAYKMVKRLRESGFSDAQAEAVTGAIQDASSVDLSHLSTREDLGAAKAELQAEIQSVRTELRAEIKASAAETKADILRRMFGAMAAQTALIVGLVKLIH